LKTTGSEFLISLQRAPELDGTDIVIGRIISGYTIIDKVAAAVHDVSQGVPVVGDCGLLGEGLSPEALENVIAARRETHAEAASVTKSLEAEKPADTKARLKREAEEQGDALKDALADGMSQAQKRQRGLEDATKGSAGVSKSTAAGGGGIRG